MIHAQELKIETRRTARLFCLGNPSEALQYWMVFHGYGQLGPYFIRHFEPFLPVHCFWAPEALNRFYLEGLSGRVGAAWMTKVARQDDITDNLLYLDQIYREYLQPVLSNRPLNILAFSQGVATACRWMEHAQPELYKVILWSGMLPQDMPTEGLRKILLHQRATIVYGTNDPYISDDNLKAVSEFMYREAPGVRVRTHEGGHHFDKTLLAELVRE